MKYGKLFKAYMKATNNVHTPTMNKLSLLKYSELRTMAKNLYALDMPDVKRNLRRYTNANHDSLKSMVYSALLLLK